MSEPTEPEVWEHFSSTQRATVQALVFTNTLTLQIMRALEISPTELLRELESPPAYSLVRERMKGTT